MTACQDCAAGTYSSSAGTTACKTCEIGTYAPVSQSKICLQCKNCTLFAQIVISECAIGSVSDTKVCGCIAGFYGSKDDGICKKCPNNTYSLNGSATSLFDCKCVAGYYCTYLKRLSVIVRLNSTTLGNFDQTQQTLFVNAMAKAAGVLPSSVSVVSVNSVSTTTRRLLFNGKYDTEDAHVILKFNISDSDTFYENVAYTHLEHQFGSKLEKSIVWETNQDINIVKRN